MADNDAFKTAGTTDLEAVITAQAKDIGHEWKDEMVLTGDCRDQWGDGCYLKLKGDTTKYCHGQNGGPPINLALAV